MSSDWDAKLYLTFADERTRPARELLARVPLASVGEAVDLGCGPGNSTELLAERWPEAKLLGIDTSDDMLAAARSRLPAARFEKADIAAWAASSPKPDLIFANAAMQWVTGHEVQFPRLVAQLAPGGVLAVQMPDNLDEPSHRAMREVAGRGPWAQKLGNASAIREKILPAEAYYDLLVRAGATVDVWRTVYHHVMSGPADIVTWLRATGLKPFLDPLAETERADFLAAYETALAQHYPRRADGRVLLAFPRLFLVARR